MDVNFPPCRSHYGWHNTRHVKGHCGSPSPVENMHRDLNDNDPRRCLLCGGHAPGQKHWQQTPDPWGNHQGFQPLAMAQSLVETNSLKCSTHVQRSKWFCSMNDLSVCVSGIVFTDVDVRRSPDVYACGYSVLGPTSLSIIVCLLSVGLSVVVCLVFVGRFSGASSDGRCYISWFSVLKCLRTTMRPEAIHPTLQGSKYRVD